jgi:hypothetical protein
MALFKKKNDPISERARALNDQIAALEAQIQQLSALPPPPPPAAPATIPSSPAPRLRSTAVPHGHPAAPNPAAGGGSREAIFEELDQNRADPQAETATPEHYNELGVRKYDLAAVLRRTTNHFRGPATSNPRLVNYLAAGSIQGLRPLRYEKRVARNRVIVLVVFLLLVLWGTLWLFLSRK